MNNTLFIDGRNFLGKLKEVLNPNKEKGKKIDLTVYNFAGLINKVLTGINLNRKIFYLGKLQKHPETKKKSEELIEEQRKLKNHLEQQGFEVIIAGRVRGHLEKRALTFKEKGVDVKIAADMIVMAYRNELKTAIIGSSDSDLQPAIKALEEQGIERIYLGFEISPNKGLAYTTNRTILIRNTEVLEFQN